MIEVIQSILQSDGAGEIKARYRDKLAMIVEVSAYHIIMAVGKLIMIRF